MTTPTRGFREPSYFVLASLLDGPRHGYGIIKQAALLSNGEVRLAPGTLYGALDRLAAAGLIQSSGQEVVAGRPRHYYRLTEVGRDSLLTEARRLAAAAAAVLDLVTAQNGVHDQDGVHDQQGVHDQHGGSERPEPAVATAEPTIDLDAMERDAAAPNRPYERPLNGAYPSAGSVHNVSATQPSSSPARVLDSVASHRP